VCAALAAALLCSVAAAPRAAAQSGSDQASLLDRARTELGELRYDDALATADRALAAGTSGPATTAQIYLLLGEVQASLGQRGDAERAFQRALAIDPELQLRKGVSPKISRPFRRARRARRGDRSLELAHRIVALDPPTVAVLVQSDPLGMVVGARVRYWPERGPGRSVSGRGKVRIDLVLPRTAARFTVAGVDQHGNRVVELGSEQRPLPLDDTARPAAEAAVAAAPATHTGGAPVAEGAGGASAASPGPAQDIAPTQAVEQDSESAGTPFYASWMLWGGVALGLGAAGTWAGLSAQSSVDELDEIRASEYEFEYSKAREVADRAEQRSLIANICFATAGASAIASAILFIRDRKDGPEQERTVLTPLVGPDQVGVSAALHF
jgi:tetratricopeptide (TPR) repeat protein